MTRASRNFGRDVEHAGRGALIGTASFGRFNRMLTNTAGVTLGAAGVVAGIKATVSAASDLNEEINKSAVVFGKQGKAMLAWSKDSATAFGLSQQEALAAAGAFGAMFETSGLAENQAASMSQTMVKLAADMASFNNQDPGEMLDRLRSGLAGEAEPLRRFGVLLSENRVKHEAYRIGIAKVGAALTEQQKVQSRYSIILGDTTRQQGDFARTSGGMANQMRILKAQLTNTAAEIGENLLPAVLKVAKGFNKWLSDPHNQKRIQDDTHKTVGAFGKLYGALNKTVDAELKVGHAIGFALLSPFKSIPKVNDWVETLRNKLDGAAGAAVSLGLGFASATNEALKLKVAQGDAGGKGGGKTGLVIPPSVSGTAGRAVPVTADVPFRSFQLANAEATKARRDDERILATIVSALRSRLTKARTLTAKTEIQNAINQYQGQLQGLLDQDAQGVKDAADALKQKRQDARDAAKQALDDLAASTAEQVRRLREQAAQIKADDRARRSQFQTPLGIQLAEAKAEATGSKKGLRSAILDARKSARAALKSGNLLIQGQIDAWNTIKDANDRLTGKIKQDVGTKFHKANADALASGLGLSGDAKRELRARLSRVGANGTEAATGTGAFGHPIIVQSPPIYLDGRIIANSTTKHQQTRARRNPPQKRGPHGI